MMGDDSQHGVDADLRFPVSPNRPDASDPSQADTQIVNSVPVADAPHYSGVGADAAMPGPESVGADGSPAGQPTGDIVDTFWDIPDIEFPSLESSGTRTDGPRHAASGGGAKTGGDDAETTVLNSGTPEATSVLSTGAAEEADGATTVAETSMLDGTHLFPETGPAAQPCTVLGNLADGSGFDFDFNDIVNGTAETIEPVEAKPGEASHVADQPRRSLKPLAVGIVAVVLVVALIVAGVLLWRDREDDGDHVAALSSCTRSSQTYADARSALDAALDGAEDARAITADQVADPTVVDALNAAVSDAEAIDEAASCSASLSTTELNANADTNNALADRLNDGAQAVTTAAQAVTASRDAKNSTDVTAARDALQNAVNDAQTLLNNSLYAVADNSTRVTLEEAIDAANEMLQRQDADLPSLQTAQSALQTASDGVNASMQALSAQTTTRQQQTQRYPDTGNYGGGATVPDGGATDNGGAGAVPDGGATDGGTDTGNGDNGGVTPDGDAGTTDPMGGTSDGGATETVPPVGGGVDPGGMGGDVIQ